MNAAGVEPDSVPDDGTFAVAEIVDRPQHRHLVGPFGADALKYAIDRTDGAFGRLLRD